MDTKSLNSAMASHLSRQMRQLKSELINDKFSSLLSSAIKQSDWHLSLYRFATEKPFRFLNLEVINDTLNVLKVNPLSTFYTLESNEADLTRAIFSLLRPSSTRHKDIAEIIGIETPQDIEDFDSIWHPEYVRYCEQVYNHLMKVPLDVIGKQRGKNYIEPTLPNRAKLLDDLGLTRLTQGYDSVVRNAISHGRVAYGIRDIQYIDTKSQKSLFAWDCVGLYDNLVTTCNSLTVALLLFLVEHQTLVEKQGVHKLPLGIKFMLTDGFASHTGSRLIYFVESTINGNKKQLNIAMKIDSASRALHQFETFHASWAACQFGCSKYDRFLVSIDCGMPAQPIIAFHGQPLLEAITNNKSLSEAVPTILDSSLLWYDTKSIRDYVFALNHSLKVNWQIQARKFKLSLQQSGSFVPSLEYEIVSVRNISPRTFGRIEAHVVLKRKGRIAETSLLQIIKSVLDQVRRRWIKRKDLYGEKGFPSSPYSVLMRIYSVDESLRRLATYSWQDDKLIAIAEWSRNWKKAPPFYTKQLDRTFKGIRIKYNPKVITLVT
jgi:hypothetical protein